PRVRAPGERNGGPLLCPPRGIRPPARRPPVLGMGRREVAPARLCLPRTGPRCGIRWLGNPRHPGGFPARPGKRPAPPDPWLEDPPLYLGRRNPTSPAV